MFEVGRWKMPISKYGTWWLPEQPDRPTSGTLAYSSDGLRLSCSPTPPIDKALDSRGFMIHGEADGEHWTLAGCGWQSRGSSGQVIRLDVAFEGLLLDEDDLEQFDEICFSLEGIWSGTAASPRKVGATDGVRVAVRTDLPAGGTVGLISEIEQLDDPHEGASAFEDRLVLVGRAPTAGPFEDLLRTFYAPLRDLLALALQRGTSTTYCMASGAGTMYESNGEMQRAGVLAYWDPVGAPRARVRDSPPAIQIPVRADEFQPLVNSWFSLYENIQTPIALRLADFNSDMSYSEPRFLQVAQALEALHRRLYPDARDERGSGARAEALAAAAPEHLNALESLLRHAHEPRFRRRLKDLAAEVRQSLEEVIQQKPGPAIDALVEVRNRVTHWDVSTPAARGLSLVGMRQFADALFDLVVVSRLDVPPDALQRVVAAHQANHVAYWLDRALADLAAQI